jgi:hypothetical protein
VLLGFARARRGGRRTRQHVLTSERELNCRYWGSLSRPLQDILSSNCEVQTTTEGFAPPPSRVVPARTILGCSRTDRRWSTPDPGPGPATRVDLRAELARIPAVANGSSVG